jgi:ActR/RegA family two-component response regulator
MTDERVLVVEDTAQMRAILNRALGRAGYRVDLASTLTEARGMDPGRYDAVLIDANLGAERGTDLVEELRARDEAAIGRCLIITGGSLAALPAGVASLAKPFQLTDLLGAVRALHQQPAGRERSGPGAASTGQRGTDMSMGGGSPAAAAPEADPVAFGGPPLWRLLGVTRRLRARERDHLADYLHDGPIQDLAAATLELHLLRRSAAYAQSPELDTVLGRLDATAKALRAVMAGPEPPGSVPPGTVPSGTAPSGTAPPETSSPLDRALQRQVAWLAAPVRVDSGSGCAGLSAAEAAAVVDIAELMLFAMTPGPPPAEAHAEVLAADAEITVRLSVVPGQADGQAGGDRAAVRAALDGLAAVLSASIGAEFRPGRWRSWTTLPRALSPSQARTGQGSGIAPAPRPAASPDHAFSDQVLSRPLPREQGAVRPAGWGHCEFWASRGRRDLRPGRRWQVPLCLTASGHHSRIVIAGATPACIARSPQGSGVRPLWGAGVGGDVFAVAPLRVWLACQAWGLKSHNPVGWPDSWYVKECAVLGP